MAYMRQHRRPDENKRRALFIGLGAVVAIVLIIQFAAPQTFPSLFGAMARPFWRIGIYADEGGFRNNASLLAENEYLKRQLADLSAGYASSTAGMLQADNRDLLAIMGRSTTTPKHFVLGAVLSRPPLAPYDELIIDVGEGDGIATTSKVYSPEKVLIGRIAELQSGSAKAVLYSSPRESYSVLIGPSRVSAVAIGQGGGQYRASVPHGSNIQVGDFVSDGALYDRPFAVVVSVVTDPSDPFDSVLLAPPVNIFDSRFVLVDVPQAPSSKAKASAR